MKTIEQLKNDNELLRMLLSEVAQNNVHVKGLGGVVTTIAIEESNILRNLERKRDKLNFVGV